MHRIALLVAFAFSGAAALSYEVVWTRALSVVLGSTTFALSSMLASFMMGLAIGGVAGGRIADRTARPLAWFGACELGIGLGGLASQLVIGALPALYLGVYRRFHLEPASFFALQIGICSLLMLVPTVLMGMTFPLVTKALVDAPERVGTIVGRAYGVNTLGSVVGAMASGFWLVPALGLRGATAAAAAVNLSIGTAAVVSAGRPAARILALALLYLPAAAAVWWTDAKVPFVGIHTMYRHLGKETYDELEARDRGHQQLLFSEEGVDGQVAAYRTRDGYLTLRVGGKLEGTTAADETNTLLLAYLPVAAHAAPRSMLVVGLGAGVTLEAGRKLVPEVDLVEINAAVLEAVAAFGPRGVLDGVRIHHADARNFLFRTDLRYDVISSEPSYPSDLGVGNLFTREYYEIAASRLADGGVYCQWLPYYLMTNEDVTLMVKTFASVFPHATLWKVPDSMDLLLLGSLRPFARAPPAVAARVAELGPRRPLSFVLSRDEEGVRAVSRMEAVPINTDDRPELEFRVARNLRVGDLSLLERRGGR
jgi:spermidine synthase